MNQMKYLPKVSSKMIKIGPEINLSMLGNYNNIPGGLSMRLFHEGIMLISSYCVSLIKGT